MICAENPSNTLRKVSEIYDRIAFAGVGKYNEFDQLRIAGVRAADLKGYSFSREDVDARSLANQYAQILGQVFTHEMKPMEVEILVAEVGDDPANDQLFHILYDGTVIDESKFAVLGGDAETIAATTRIVVAGRPDHRRRHQGGGRRTRRTRSHPGARRSRGGRPRAQRPTPRLPPHRRRRTHVRPGGLIQIDVALLSVRVTASTTTPATMAKARRRRGPPRSVGRSSAWSSSS